MKSDFSHTKKHPTIPDAIITTHTHTPFDGKCVEAFYLFQLFSGDGDTIGYPRCSKRIRPEVKFQQAQNHLINAIYRVASPLCRDALCKCLEVL